MVVKFNDGTFWRKEYKYTVKNTKEIFMLEKKLDFFAAANGYGGFRSYFDTVFKSEDYDKIYVIKGGPGTGKSSFMKKIADRYAAQNCYVERIHCSSDPNSLDGVIVNSRDKRIALLDGTAPHERDAVIVGAIDEIINLGASLDTRFLSAQRGEITALNKEKKRAYATAYYYLEIAGVASKRKKALTVSRFNTEKAKNELNYLAELSKECDFRSETTRLVSSFGSHGRSHIPTVEGASKKLYSILGDYYECVLLIGEIYKLFKSRKTDIIFSPSPLDGDCIEALYLPKEGIGFVIGGEGEGITANEFFTPLDKTDGECIKKAAEIEEEALEEAMRWFAIASHLHFRLEKIYSSAMNFDINNKIFEEKSREIDNILESQG